MVDPSCELAPATKNPLDLSIYTQDHPWIENALHEMAVGDPDTYNHVMRVAIFAGIFMDYIRGAELFDLEDADKDTLIRASMVHDIGKMHPYNYYHLVLQRRASPTENMKHARDEARLSHPVLGREMLEHQAEIDPRILLIVENHHLNGNTQTQLDPTIEGLVRIFKVIDSLDSSTRERYFFNQPSSERIALFHALEGIGLRIERGIDFPETLHTPFRQFQNWFQSEDGITFLEELYEKYPLQIDG